MSEVTKGRHGRTRPSPRRRLGEAVAAYDARARALLACAFPASVSMLLMSTAPGVARPGWQATLQLITASLFAVVGSVTARRTISVLGTSLFSLYATGVFVALCLGVADPLLATVLALCVLVPPLFACMFAPGREAVVHVLVAIGSALVLIGRIEPGEGIGVLLAFGVVLLVAAPATILLILRQQLDRARRVAESLAVTDPLTGLLNRRGMLERIPAQVAAARREGHLMAVYVADVDHFKQVNDTHGHLRGDEVLAGLAGRVRAGCRTDDLVVRLGGEEIVVVAAIDSPEELGACAERIRTSAHEPAGPDLPAVTVSVGGVVDAPPEGTPAELDAWLHALIDQPDDCMSAA